MVYATILGFFDKHQGSSTVILTAALVAVTAFYAWQNRKMVSEMKKARDAAILPKLALDFHPIGPDVVDLAIRNVGPGAAIDIDIRTEWVPVDASAPAPGARWRRNIMSPGEEVQLFLPTKGDRNLKALSETYKEVRLVGAMADAAGNPHEVDERFEDLPEWVRLLKDAHQSWKPPEPERRTADAMYSKFERPLKDLTNAAREIARAVRA